MPFMIGRAPIRRTLQYLESGQLYLQSKIQVLSINYNVRGTHHKGARDLVFWNVPQIKYKNPNVQIVTFRNMTPTPFITLYYEDGKEMLVDIDGKSKEEIISHLVKVAGKTKEEADIESLKQRRTESPANFGYGCSKPCMCVIMGQVPCPSTVPLPLHMRGKYKFAKKED